MLKQSRSMTKCTRNVCSCSVRSLQVAWNIKVQRAFYRLGYFVATYPIRHVCAAFVLVVLLLFGIIMFKNETDTLNLYLPESSRIRMDANQKEAHFGNTFRKESVIVTAPNVLKQEVISFMAKIDDAVKSTVVDDITWTDVCFPFSSFFINNASDLDEQMFGVVKDLDKALNGCIYDSPIKLWEVNGSNDVVYTLLQKHILKDITEALNTTLLKGRKTTKIKYEDISKLIASVEPLIAEVTRDKTAKVIGAKATIMFWMLKKTPEAEAWERGFTDTLVQLRKELPESVTMYIFTERGFDDELQAILGLNKFSLIMGVIIISIFVISIVHKVLLVTAGALSVAMAAGASFGISFLMGYFWGPLHPILPFLLMGIGVDNIFILSGALKSLSAVQKTLSVPERIGLAMQHAGPSVTITSATNALAFAIGVSSDIPFFKSFCVFASWSIVFLFIFQIFFFVACIAISEWYPNCFCNCSLKPLIWRITKWWPQKNIFSEYLGPILMKKYTKVVVLLLTISFFGINVYWMEKLDQNFNPMLYLNANSDPVKYYNALNELFPHFSQHAGVYIGPGIDYFNDKEMLLKLEDRLCHNPYVHSVTFWYSKYLKWLDEKYPYANPENTEELTGYLFEFLFLTTEGLQMVPTMRFTGFPLADFNITSSMISFQNKKINGSADQAKAMASLFEIIDEVAADNEVWLYSEEYISWDTNQNIAKGMARNLQLAVFGVGIISALLFLNLRLSIFVMTCVIFTVVGLMGCLYWMNICLEIASSLVLLLCGSLSVDYATHVAIRFSQLYGSREERAIGANRDMGAAVLCGGFSTFLAFVFLWTSKSYLFRTFCNLFTAVVILGLFHGLIYLPVVLSLLGPKRGQGDWLSVSWADYERRGARFPRSSSLALLSDVPSSQQCYGKFDMSDMENEVAQIEPNRCLGDVESNHRQQANLTGPQQNRAPEAIEVDYTES